MKVKLNCTKIRTPYKLICYLHLSLCFCFYSLPGRNDQSRHDFDKSG